MIFNYLKEMPKSSILGLVKVLHPDYIQLEFMLIIKYLKWLNYAFRKDIRVIKVITKISLFAMFGS